MVGVAVTAPAVLDVHDLRVSYAGAVRALRGVSLTVPEGGVVAVLGANGAGKSTLLRAISGTLPLQGGAIDARRDRVRRPRPRAATTPATSSAAGSCRCPRAAAIFGELTVEENLRAGAHHRRATRRPREARARARLRAVPAPGRAPARSAPGCCPAASSRCSRSAAR